MFRFYPCSIKFLNSTVVNTSLMKYDVQIRNKKVQLYKINTYLGKKIYVASHFHAGSIFSLDWLDQHSAYIKKIPGNPRIACSYLLAISDALKKPKNVADLFLASSKSSRLQIWSQIVADFYSRLFHLLACQNLIT